MNQSHSKNHSMLFESNDITPMEVIEETGSCSNVDSNEKRRETTRSVLLEIIFNNLSTITKEEQFAIFALLALSCHHNMNEKEELVKELKKELLEYHNIKITNEPRSLTTRESSGNNSSSLWNSMKRRRVNHHHQDQRDLSFSQAFDHEINLYYINICYKSSIGKILCNGGKKNRRNFRNFLCLPDDIYPFLPRLSKVNDYFLQPET
ncbi:hypothetical protein KQX54_009244 [Cotesia glomerata]|uniref:Uncharacterized protein n=1 Tax=Cotesia glomerata TaxID=32391 RepID=A0AAV7IH92_COTGL|nr:hypothetical protein KQX54_009244 [Cotesia glomerata]